MLVQDRKTGQWYDPQVQFAKLLAAEWFIKQMQAMRNK